MKQFKIELNQSELNTILNALAHMQLKDSYNIFVKLSAFVVDQVDDNQREPEDNSGSFSENIKAK